MCVTACSHVTGQLRLLLVHRVASLVAVCLSNCVLRSVPSNAVITHPPAGVGHIKQTVVVSRTFQSASQSVYQSAISLCGRGLEHASTSHHQPVFQEKRLLSCLLHKRRQHRELQRSPISLARAPDRYVLGMLLSLFPFQCSPKINEERQQTNPQVLTNFHAKLQHNMHNDSTVKDTSNPKQR